MALVDQREVQVIFPQMKCRNCDRVVTWTRRRCPACQTKLPTWYVFAAAGIIIGIFIAFKIVEKIL